MFITLTMIFALLKNEFVILMVGLLSLSNGLVIFMMRFIILMI